MDSKFERRYEYELLEEGPAKGSSRHFYYPGATKAGGSDGLLIRVQPQVGDSWIGTFAFGCVLKKRGMSRVFATPNPDVMCVVANGEGYLVSASDPQTWEEVNAVPVLDVRQIPARSLIVFADFTSLVAYGEGGIRWRSGQIGADELSILDSSADRISGTWWNPAKGATSEFVVDTMSGELIGGTRWELS